MFGPHTLTTKHPSQSTNSCFHSCLHVCGLYSHVLCLITLFSHFCPLPHKSRNLINYTRGIHWHSKHKESHCGAGTMRHGWIYIEPLWYIQHSDRRSQTGQRAEKTPLSGRSDWTLTNVLHADVRNSSNILQNHCVCVWECERVCNPYIF